MRHHVFYGALYHWFVLFRNGHYRKMSRHRELPVIAETMLYTKRLLLMPFIAIDRRIASARIRFGGFPYHLVLMQLEHDASFQQHSPFTRMSEFIIAVMEGFAKGTARLLLKCPAVAAFLCRVRWKTMPLFAWGPAMFAPMRAY